MPVATGELKKLEDIVNLMKSSDESLQMLKGGSTAGREVLTVVAEQGLSEVSQSGMKALRGLISKEGLQKAKEQLITLGVARTELIAKLDKLIANGNLLSDTKVILTKAKNSLLDHLTQEDLVGALRDKFGKEIRRSGDGKIYNHLGEVSESLDSLDNAKGTLLRQLRNEQKGSDAYVKLSNQIDAISEMRRRVKAFLETK